MITRRWKQVQNEDDIAALEVHLPEVGGVPPRTYFPIAALVTLLMAIAAVLVLPGMVRYGTRYTVTSVPEGAEVIRDGVRIGSTPVTVFIPAGEHEITVHSAGRSVTRNITVGGRRIASLIWPRTENLRVPFLEPPTPEYTSRVVDEFAAWALNGTPSARFQQPPVATELARAIWATPTSDEERTEFWQDLLAHASGDQIRDLSHAILRSALPGAAFTPRNLAQIVRFFIQSDKDSPYISYLADLLPDTLRGTVGVTSSVWYTDRREALATAVLAASIVPDERPVPLSQRTEVGKTTYARVPAGSHVIGYPLRGDNARGEPLRFGSFWVASEEVTKGQFARFVDQESAWQPQNSDLLAEQGLADERYLFDWPDDWRRWLTAPRAGSAAEPVVYVSRPAAKAYARWFNLRNRAEVAALGEGAIVTLPSARQWEYAAFLNRLGTPTVVAQDVRPHTAGLTTLWQDYPGALGLYHMAGNVWEWSSVWYAHQALVFPPRTGDQALVLGGSYATGEASHTLRGAQPPQWCTPFLGFRTVIVTEESTVTYDG